VQVFVSKVPFLSSANRWSPAPKVSTKFPKRQNIPKTSIPAKCHGFWRQENWLGYAVYYIFTLFAFSRNTAAADG
jgi:hypothetical protein